ncbi:MAG TPA: hypothetical protein VGP93_11585, partial [Polyangiaceae bacterium]|nr:hypothetical protein [Polyangiaceae bacterium]
MNAEHSVMNAKNISTVAGLASACCLLSALLLGCGTGGDEAGAGGSGAATGGSAGKSAAGGSGTGGASGGASGSAGSSATGGSAGKGGVTGGSSSGGSSSGGSSSGGSTSGGPTTCTDSEPAEAAPASSWVNSTGNLANMAATCGTLSRLVSKPCSKTLIAGVAGAGLWSSEDSGQNWTKLGGGAGSAVIDNNPLSIVFDPTAPDH